MREQIYHQYGIKEQMSQALEAQQPLSEITEPERKVHQPSAMQKLVTYMIGKL